MKNFNKFFKFTLLFVLITLFSEFSIFAKEKYRYVSVENASLKESSGFFSKKIQDLHYGEELIVLTDKKDDKWVEVAVNNDKSKSGWVMKKETSERKIVNRFEKTGSTDKELALAGKGFSEEQLERGKADYEELGKMENVEIRSEDLKDFIIQGNLRME